MPTRELRTADLLGAPAYDRAGGYLGRIADLVVVCDPDGRWRLSEVVVTKRVLLRLFGYDPGEQAGPWPLEQLARRLIRRDLTRIPWSDVRIGDPGPD